MASVTQSSKTDPAMLLTYAVTTDPDPIQASPKQGDPNKVTISVTVDNLGDKPVYVKQIIFQFTIDPDPKHPDASMLTTVGTGIKASAEPAADWQIATSDDGNFTATPKTVVSQKITGQSLTFTLYDIQVSQELGSFTFTIVESTSLDDTTYQPHTKAVEMAKFPSRFFARNFQSDESYVPDGGQATLRWEVSQGATATMEWNNKTEDVTTVRSWTTPALSESTTFRLKVSTTQSGETVYTYLTAPVTVVKVSVNKLVVDPPKVGLGQSFTVSWATSNADECILYPPDGLGMEEKVKPQGSKTYQATTELEGQQEVKFTITAKNKDGSDPAQEQRTVTLEPPVIDSFQAFSPQGDKELSKGVAKGAQVKLKWKTRFASTCSLDQGFGDVTGKEEQLITVKEPMTITLTCKGYHKPASSSVTIRVANWITEFSLPDEAPTSIAVGPDGSLWVTDEGGKILHITTSGQNLGEIPLPAEIAGPSLFAVEPDGTLWVSDLNDNILHIDTSGQKLGEIPHPAGKYNSSIAVEPDGTLWVSDPNSKKILHFDTSGQYLGEIPLPAGSQPFGITVVPDGTLWATDLGGKKILHFTTSGQKLGEIPLPAGSQLFDITVVPDGTLWVSDLNEEMWKFRILHIATSGKYLGEVPLPAGASAFTVGPDGNLWVISGQKFARMELP